MFYGNTKLFCVLIILSSGVGACQKTTTAPAISGVAGLTVSDFINNSYPVIPVLNTASSIEYFSGAQILPYDSYFEFSATSGSDTLYVVQNVDTLNVGPKATGLMFDSILNLKKGSIYSLFLCGDDTASPEYLLTLDSLPYYGPSDSVMGIRFVNLVSGSNPFSINLEGNAAGSEVGSLAYKNITSFKAYPCNSMTSPSNFFFVVRDAATGDSLTQFNFNQNSGDGLQDPVTGHLLTFRNSTIVIYGAENTINYPMNTVNYPISTTMIEDF